MGHCFLARINVWHCSLEIYLRHSTSHPQLYPAPKHLPNPTLIYSILPPRLISQVSSFHSSFKQQYFSPSVFSHIYSHCFYWHYYIFTYILSFPPTSSHTLPHTSQSLSFTHLISSRIISPITPRPRELLRPFVI